MSIRLSYRFLMLILASSAYAQDTFPRDAITMQLDCSLRCVNEPKAWPVVLTKTFDPMSQGMKRGNMGIWASLPTELSLWAEEACFAVAAKRCASASLVGVSKLIKMSSNEWSWSGALSCKSPGITVSPFDRSVGSEKNRLEGIPKPSTEKAVVIASQAFDASTCKNVEAIQACGADCMNAEGLECADLPLEQLCTPTPGLDLRRNFCADSLVKQLKKNRTPRAEFIHGCRRAVFENLRARAEDKMFFQCGSMRLDFDCDAWYTKFSAQVPVNSKTKNFRDAQGAEQH